jgi:hypothetical protein
MTKYNPPEISAGLAANCSEPESPMQLDGTILTPFYLVGVVRSDVTLRTKPIASRFGFYVAGIALIVLATMGSYSLLDQKNLPQWLTRFSATLLHFTHSSSQLSPQLPALKSLKLPLLAKQGQQDPAFTASSPGWERYVSATSEFRVYRIADDIKAVQFIALKDTSITDASFNELLREISCDGANWNGLKGQENGFDIARGTVSCGAEFMTYRKSGNHTISAFVVALP